MNTPHWSVGTRTFRADLASGPSQHDRSQRSAATANGVAGGKQTVHMAGLNWYVNRNVGFMFNYLHGDIDKQVSATNVGAKFDALAVRTHIAF